jgi:hypothetical protein
VGTVALARAAVPPGGIKLQRVSIDHLIYFDKGNTELMQGAHHKGGGGGGGGEGGGGERRWLHPATAKLSGCFHQPSPERVKIPQPSATKHDVRSD